MSTRSFIRACRTACLLFAVPVCVAVPAAAAAQTPADSVRAELRRLAALVDSLRAEVGRLQAQGREEEAGDALADLRAAAAAAAAAGGPPPSQEAPEDTEFVSRQRSLQSLNPEISVNADVFGHLNPDDTGEDNFVARGFEISLVSNLDPYSRAKVFVARHGGGGEVTPFVHDDEHDEHGAGFAVEEGYIEWVGLPGGLGLKFGRFFQQFGQLNRWHAHALPFQSRSLPHLAFIGEDPLAQTGGSLHWLAPFGGSAGTYEATVEVTRRENELLFGESGGVSVLGHLNGFWNLSESTDIDLGVSWLRGSIESDEGSADRTLFGVEGAFHWRPPGQSRYRGLMVRGGVMVLDGLLPHDDGGAAPEPDEPATRALGVWSLAEMRLSRSWLVGARFDRTENPEDPDETAWLVSPTLTWWQSEFVRLRAEYDLLGRSVLADREGRFVLQVTFAMGPHKHETY